MAVKVYFKRTLSLIILTCFLTLLVFTSFNKAKEVKAEVLSAVALGVGCLAVLVASYFSTAGIEISQSSGSGTSYFEDFINDSIQQFKEDDAQSQAIFDQYFDSEGRYIGTEEDLQFILSPSARGYWSMGKDLVSGLESFKNWFVSENSLSVNENVSLLSSVGFSYEDLFYHVYVGSMTGYTPSASDLLSQSFYNHESGSSHTFDETIWLTDNLVFRTISTGRYLDNYFYNGSMEQLATRHIDLKNVLGNNIYYFLNYNNSNNTLNCNVYAVFSNYTVSNNLGTLTLTGNYSENISSISLDGSLTDGYDDFQEALDGDLENVSENDDAVVVTGVGELGTDLTYDQIKELILQNVITGALNPTYEGTYENQEAAEEDLDKEQPIVTPEWRPTLVIVNGLEDFFPFCIPFDLYAVIELLNTEPVAPKFNGHLDFAGIFQAQDIELDFSQFEYLARIVRVIIVIAFLIFIILKTRDMIRG